MSAQESDAILIQRQERLVRGLQTSIFSQGDPAEDAEAIARLAEAQAKLDGLRRGRAKAETASQDVASSRSGSGGRFLGADTTGLEVQVTLNMDPIPTGAYHLMDPETDPLLSVAVKNVSRETRRICVRSYIEGLSAQAVRTIEVPARQQSEFRLQPTLFPDRVRAITEIQRATLHVVVEDLDGKLESHNTYIITMLARTSSFNAVRRPGSGEPLDLSHYYGAWVTPHAAAVGERIRRAVELSPSRKMMGYQGDPDEVPLQVESLYKSLRESEIVYVNSVIDYGAEAGMTTQRTRLPRESMEQRSANCIDGAVLLASLIEGVSLNPAIVLLPGHAFVGWEKWTDSDEWEFLETTMMGTAEFDAAVKSARRQYDQFTKYNPDSIKLHSVNDLRARGIWPME